MKLKLLSIAYLMGIITSFAQGVEYFESTTVGAKSFTNSSQSFTLTNALKVTELNGAGVDASTPASTSANSKRYLDNLGSGAKNQTNSIKTTNGSLFTIKNLYFYVSTVDNNTNSPSSDGSITFKGKLAGSLKFTRTISTGLNVNFSPYSGFNYVDFATGTDNSLTNIDELEFTIGGNFVYVAIDNFGWGSAVVAPSLSASGSLSSFNTCSGVVSSAQTFLVSGSNLTANLIVAAPTGYEVSTTSGSGYASSISLTPSSGTVSSTTVFVRLTSGASGTPSGNTTVSSTGATSSSLLVSGVINQPSSTTISKTVCDSYLFNGILRSESDTYSATFTNKAGCDSIVTLNLTIYNTPSAPMLTSTSVCGQGVDTLNVINVGRVNIPNPIVYTWYDAAVGGNVVGTGEQFITPNLTETKSYYATLTYMGCESQRNQVDAVVNFIPSAPYVAPSNPVCGEGGFTFEANIPTRINCRNCDPFDYEWTNYNGDVVGIDPIYSTGTLSSSTYYYVTTSYNGCKSEPTEVLAEVLNIPAPTLTESKPFTCFGLPAELQVANAVPTRVADCRGCNEMYDYTWYNENDDSVGTSSSYTTPNLMEPSIYYLVASDRGCKSSATKIEIAVKQAAKITQSPANVFACGEGESKGFKVKATGDDLQYGLGLVIAGKIVEAVPYEFDTLAFTTEYNQNGQGIVFFVYNECAMDTSDVAFITIYNKVDTSVVLTNKILSAIKSGVQYQWINCDKNGEIIDGENNQSFTPTVSGNYAVIVYDPNACNLQDTSACKYVDVNVTSVSDSQTSTLSVYPNPASDVVNVTLPSSIDGGVVSISDIHGNEVVSKSVSGLEFSISTSDLSSGVYILKVSSSTLTATKQIVVVK